MAITWPQIGSQYFVELLGDLEPQGKTLEEITRAGVDGVAFRELGDRGQKSQLLGAAIVETSAAAKTLLSTYKGMIGSTVSIIQAEQTSTNYLILDVGDFVRKQIATPVGGNFSDGTAIANESPCWLVSSRWEVQYVGT